VPTVGRQTSGPAHACHSSELRHFFSAHHTHSAGNVIKQNRIDSETNSTAQGSETSHRKAGNTVTHLPPAAARAAAAAAARCLPRTRSSSPTTGLAGPDWGTPKPNLYSLLANPPEPASIAPSTLLKSAAFCTVPNRRSFSRGRQRC